MSDSRPLSDGSTRQLSVAVVGATGAVGEALLSLLEGAPFSIRDFYPVASRGSVGKTVLFRNKNYLLKTLEEMDFSVVDLVFFVSHAELSQEWVPKALEAGALVIDNSSAFRLEAGVPLIIPEVNGQSLLEHFQNNPEQRLVANPNCATIQLLVALKEIHDTFKITHIVVATYQSVSGAGQEAISSLAQESVQLLQGQRCETPFFSQQIAFNVIPQIDKMQENGYTAEELKMHWETRKILHNPDIVVQATCVRVPVFYGHSEAVCCETEHPCSREELASLLRKTEGVEYRDYQSYPTPIEVAAGEDKVYVGRLRENLGEGFGFQLWIVADAVRKGAALNALNIASLLFKEGYL
jgi:aspartate-semialdehyde dehydrogenase